MSHAVQPALPAAPYVRPNAAAIQKGHTYQCFCHHGRTLGLIALVMGAALVIFASILASGVFGGGKLSFVAAGLCAISVICFAASVCLLSTIHQKA